MPEQFPFTLRQVLDRTRDELQAEMYDQKQALKADGADNPIYSSGEVLTLYHEAAMRALVALSSGAHSSAQTAEHIAQALDRRQQLEVAGVPAPVTVPTRKAKRSRKPAKPAKRSRR